MWTPSISIVSAILAELVFDAAGKSLLAREFRIWKVGWSRTRPFINSPACDGPHDPI